jgi:hypothetical protein
MFGVTPQFGVSLFYGTEGETEGRDRGEETGGIGRREEAEGKRQRGRGRGKEAEGKRQRERGRGEETEKETIAGH